MMTPPAHADAFLADNSWAGATVEPLAGDASFRRYFRVARDGATAVLMDAPPAHEDSRPFLFVAEHLRARGLSAPALIAGDLNTGLLLLEDFGDRLLRPALDADPALETPSYALAIDLLAELSRAPPPLELRPYDRAELLREAMIFVDYYAAAAGLTIDPDGYAAAWDAVWGDALRETDRAPVLTLRDYHADNLMLLDRAGVRGLGLLDFQDALAGHPAYDLASLLQDARREVDPALEAAMIDRFVAATDQDDPAAFRAAYDVLAAQRNTKILGVFVRLRDRDGRAGYVERLPRVWRYLERGLRRPALEPVRAWFDAHVPAAARADWCR